MIVINEKGICQIGHSISVLDYNNENNVKIRNINYQIISTLKTKNNITHLIIKLL